MNDFLSITKFQGKRTVNENHHTVVAVRFGQAKMNSYHHDGMSSRDLWLKQRSSLLQAKQRDYLRNNKA